MTSRIVMGLGATVDYELHWNSSRLNELIREYEMCSADILSPFSSVVDDERGMLCALLRAMYRSEGGECYVSDSSALTRWSERFEYEVTLGGTCLRGALALRQLGISSLVHLVSMNQHTRELLPPEIEWISSAKEDSCEPHVIVQYPGGIQLEIDGIAIETVRPNRVIFVNDRPNELLELSPKLALVAADADVFLISGFNTMKSHELLLSRLEEIRHVVENLREGTLAVYEDAGFHDDSMRSQVLEELRGICDLHSMNEDEAQYYCGRHVNMTDPRDVAQMMSELALYSVAPTWVVHTEGYAFVAGERAHECAPAVEQGCQLAAMRYAYGDAGSPEAYSRVSEVSRSKMMDVEGVVVVPGFRVSELLASDPTTIGLGDAFIGGVVGGLSHMG